MAMMCFRSGQARLTACVAAAVLLCSGVAHASRHEDWKRVEAIAPGQPIEVEAAGQAREACLMVMADDALLTCRRDPDPEADWRGGANARVVFPRAAVDSVWVWQDVTDRRFLVRIGIGFAIGALVCSSLGPGPAFICAGIGALIALAPEPAPYYRYPRWPPPNYPVRVPDLRRKLQYRAPRSGVTETPAVPAPSTP